MRAIKSQIKELARSKFFIILISVAVFLTVVPSTLAIMGRQDLLRAAANLIATPFKAAAKWCGDGLAGFFEYFTEFDRLKAENEELRALLEEERKKNDAADVAIEENEWMRDFLMYAGGEPQLSLIDAMAVARDAGDFMTSFTLNKGSLSGIDVGMAVIDEGGLVGYVSEVGLTYSKVTTIINDGVSVGVICPATGGYGALSGSYSYISDELCKMVCPDASAELKEGDLICTSGAGSIYPFGIAVGRITRVEKDPYSRNTIAYIEPSADLVSADRVMVVAKVTAEGTENE
jgi:rod shape-determining protein MreC